MIDVLLIALQFAPVATTGAFRVMEFAKRLPALGIRPTVLTIEPDQAEKIFGTKRDQAMLDSLPPEVNVAYVRSATEPKPEGPAWQLFRLLTTLDDTFEHRFADSVARITLEQAKDRKFKAVYATAPPFGATHLGALAARELGVPYLLDMRDAWAEWSPSKQITKRHYTRKFQDERRAFDAADRIVSVTPETEALFQRTHPDIPKDKFTVIPNGLPDIDAIGEQVEWNDAGETLDIGYVGAFYYTPPKVASLKSPHRYLQYDPRTEDWSYRSPLYFFRAWQSLDKRAPEAAARIRFHLAGRVPDWLPGMAKAHGFEDRCIFHGFKSRAEVRTFLDSMTCLLATSAKRLDGPDYSLASKSFEYLTSGRPILAFVCDGAQKRFFTGSGGAYFMDPDAPAEAANKLQSLIGKQEILPIDKGYLLDYTLPNTAKAMADELAWLAGHVTGDADVET